MRRMDTTAGQPVLVTGGSGFIGGRLVRRLIEHRCRVSCLVRAGSRTDDLRSAGAMLVTGDVADRESAQRALVESQACTVFHLAGLVRARSREEFTRVNADGVENIAVACAASGNPPVLVVLSSLAAAGPSAADRLRVEGDLPAPVSNYGRSKLAGEQATAGYAGLVPITIVRPPIVFGPGDRAVLEMFRLVSRWGIHVVPCLAGRGRRLSLIHVDDLVEGLLLAAEKGERLRGDSSLGQGIYFIAGEEHPTYAQLGQAIAKALVQRPPVVMPVPGSLLRLAGVCGDVMARFRNRPTWINSDKISEALAASWTCCSVKAREQLGWSTATLADRLHETAQWYRQSGWL
ncbi:MAG: NAD-dependent epimerase/dehydratase family protein [Phycisphaeraceae bacterium]|nr:MAG: NAD-dependent epimerase/dehydratase family protein [Phycisphaeraceae bacterium]